MLFILLLVNCVRTIYINSNKNVTVLPGEFYIIDLNFNNYDSDSQM